MSQPDEPELTGADLLAREARTGPDLWALAVRASACGKALSARLPRPTPRGEELTVADQPLGDGRGVKTGPGGDA